jgi:hypothetical protein
MKQADSSFELEKLVPGAFVLQGVMGGMLGGFVWVLALILWSTEPNYMEMVSIIPQTVFLGAIFGAILATVIWITHSGSDLRTGAGMRVVLMINIVGVIAIFLGKFSELIKDGHFPTWVMVSLVSALPTTLLVGSRVEPWALFTFGSITGIRNKVQTRMGSQNVCATFATLPLRFLSLTVLAVWIMKFSCERKPDADPMSSAIWFLTPIVYPALSAYVTFRSPRKLTLLMIAIGINLPHGLISTAAFANSSNTSWIDQLPQNVNFICLAFTVTWALFLIARLSVQTGEPVIPITGLSKFVLKRSPQP